MTGSKIRFPGVAALLLAVALPASPALAAPNLGADWVLTETKKVRQFRPQPAKLGKGKWNLKAVRDRRYFVPLGATQVTGTEATLATSTVKRTDLEKTPEAHSEEVVAGDPQVSEEVYEVEAPATTTRRAEGRQIATYEVTAIDQVKETTTVTPFQMYDDVSWQERTRKTLKNVYRVKSYLTFADPVTKQRIASQHERTESPVEEIAYTPWQTRTERRKGKAGKTVSRARSRIGTRQVEKRLAATLTAAWDGAAAAGVSLARDVGYSTGAQRGAGESSLARNVERLSGAGNARAAGGRGLDFDGLLAAAGSGMRLVDERGGAWTLRSEGGEIALTPEGGPTVALGRGLRQASAGDVAVRLEAVAAAGGGLILSGRFKNGKDQARTLRSL
ncbi:MAG: hypothetical protein FJZ01_21440 [Candidatus Sericytochromatia bacterium]|nr:hypothetical protein [Candidatus Tanganyikabacteria bacterium]